MVEAKDGSGALPAESELIIAADRLNSLFREGHFVDEAEVLEDLRKFPRPILVDFNNVLANNRSPIRPRPAARTPLSRLRDIGNVFIVTSAMSWERVQEILEAGELWHSDVVLIVSPNWLYNQESIGSNLKLIDEHIELMLKQGLSYEREDYLNAYKALAPAFAKPFLVPIIDNDHSVTVNNPGLFGICVKAWEPKADKWEREYILNVRPEDRHTLVQAVEKVRIHYTSLNV